MHKDLKNKNTIISDLLTNIWKRKEINIWNETKLDWIDKLK